MNFVSQATATGPCHSGGLLGSGTLGISRSPRSHLQRRTGSREEAGGLAAAWYLQVTTLGHMLFLATGGPILLLIEGPGPTLGLLGFLQSDSPCLKSYFLSSSSATVNGAWTSQEISTTTRGLGNEEFANLKHWE